MRNLEAQRCDRSSPSTVITVKVRGLFSTPAQCCSDVIIRKDSCPLGALDRVSAPPTTETHCEWGSQQLQVLWAADEKRGEKRKPHLHKRKTGCLSSENDFSIKFSKKIPVTENKHLEEFPNVCQISVRSLSPCCSHSLSPGPRPLPLLFWK